MNLRMENKKIKNATSKEYNGIKFKSIVEVSVYKHLLSLGFKPEYEKHKYTIWEGFKPTIPFYNQNGKNRKGNYTNWCMNKLCAKI